MIRNIFCLSAVAVAGIALLSVSEKALSHYDEPPFVVLQDHKEFEVRSYGQRLVAEVEVTGDKRQAVNKGFRKLAAYIFGNNVSREKIKMTTPVTQKLSQKIEMTAPVAAVKDGKNWKIQFFMPEKFSLETIPEPLDKSINLRVLESEQYAAIRFSGRWSEKKFEKYRNKLEGLIAEHQYERKGGALSAYYNPPWTPPFLRRNEVMIPIKMDSLDSESMKNQS